MPSYSLKPQSPVGAIVSGIDLNRKLSASTWRKLIKDVHKHKILIIKNQGVISGAQQIEITRHFGEIETAGFELHPKSPDQLILRVSNDEEEGYREFGTRGFHIDGSFMPNPNAYSIYHIINTPQEGETWFVSLNGVYFRLTAEQREKWERLWMFKKFEQIRRYKDRPGQVVHPLLYYHPVTGQKTLCIAQGKTSGFIYDFGSQNQTTVTQQETVEIFKEIDDAILADDHAHIYKHKWEPGDFIISDNLAVGHMAARNTQSTREDVGLRVMHRTIVRGRSRPSKEKPEKQTRSCLCFNKS